MFNFHKYPATLIVALGFILPVNGCKPEEASDLESVDNFTNNDSTKFSLNHCAPQSDRSIYGASPEEMTTLVDAWVSDSSRFVSDDSTTFSAVKDDIRDVLSSTPVYISKAFFAAKNTKIYLSAGESEICRKITGSNAEEAGITKTFACWSRTDEYNGLAFGAGETVNGAVNLKQALRHGLLRAMTYYYFSMILDSDAGLDAQAHEQLANLKSDEPQKLGSQMVSALRTDMAARGLSDRIDRLPGDQLRLNLYIEVIDSAFCSQQTHQKFASCFPNLYQAFSSGSAPATPIKVPATCS